MTFLVWLVSFLTMIGLCFEVQMLASSPGCIKPIIVICKLDLLYLSIPHVCLSGVCMLSAIAFVSRRLAATSPGPSPVWAKR